MTERQSPRPSCATCKGSRAFLHNVGGDGACATVCPDCGAELPALRLDALPEADGAHAAPGCDADPGDVIAVCPYPARYRVDGVLLCGLHAGQALLRWHLAHVEKGGAS